MCAGEHLLSNLFACVQKILYWRKLLLGCKWTLIGVKNCLHAYA